MNILICNVGSTSLKYQLFAMDKGERVIATGGAERVGGRESRFYWTENSAKRQERLELPTHREAIERMRRQLPPPFLLLLHNRRLSFPPRRARKNSFIPTPPFLRQAPPIRARFSVNVAFPHAERRHAARVLP